MSEFKAGFARVDITPPLGIGIAGYFVKRNAEGVLDNLEANCLAVSDGEHTAILISADLISIGQVQADIYREQISAACGIPVAACYIACTHTHTGPGVARDIGDKTYDAFLGTRLADVAKFAIDDLKPAKLSFARSEAPKVAFVRRYRMKDGKIRTNPGVNNPDIVEPIGTTDDTVQLLRIKRCGGPEIDIVNFQTHPDVIGGNLISADWPRFVRETMEAALPGIKCIYFNGTQGDTNHVNTFAKEGDLNDMFHDFDDVHRGYEHSKHMGRTVAAAALTVWAKTVDLEAGEVKFAQKNIDIPSNRPRPEQVPEAERIVALHEAGRDDEIGFTGMELTTVVAEAGRMKRLQNGPDSFELHLTAVAFGDVVFSGIPGEPFTDIGRGIKSQSPFKLTIPCCLVNGSEGYYPMMDNYNEGGYEARSSRFAPGVAERIIEGSLALINELK